MEALAVWAKRRSMIFLLKNSTGKMRRCLVVRKGRPCWTPNRMNSTPEQMNRPMILPLFHAYTEPPKLIAMTPETYAPAMRIVPRKSISSNRFLSGMPGRGSERGMQNIQTPAKAPPTQRLMSDLQSILYGRELVPGIYYLQNAHRHVALLSVNAPPMIGPE